MILNPSLASADPLRYSEALAALEPAAARQAARAGAQHLVIGRALFSSPDDPTPPGAACQPGSGVMQP
jgi:pentose-5-phosphate-3-epimerase